MTNNRMIRTKIICTSGPSMDSTKTFEDMIIKGASVIRLNCSHGNFETRLKHLKKVRSIEKKLGKSLGVMLDLQGPKLRVGELPNPFILKKDEVWCLTAYEKPNEKKKIIPLDFKKLPEVVKVGKRIYMDDGFISSVVVKKDAKNVWIKIDQDAKLNSRKGVNIPEYTGKGSVLNKKDKADVIWGLKNQVDFIALSFVRTVDDIHELKTFIQKQSPARIPLLIAKIEKPSAVDDMDRIIEASDGILVARGDLGVELSHSQVPVVQKRLIEQCRFYRKPVIVATQMLDSMRYSPLPTRAEVSDVASSIFAGTDAVLLTGETSVGNYPVECVSMISKIITDVENHLIQKKFKKTPEDFGVVELKESFVFNVMQMAEDIKSSAIVLLTKHGELAKAISKFHPKQPIFTLTNHPTYSRLTSLYWGVYPIKTMAQKPNAQIKQCLLALKKQKVIKKFSKVIFVYQNPDNLNLSLEVVECP
ncbi:pyruvate kinase [bacterium K02(2017)]|nr:pyruvate kinase [bacterium K02(2017)]